ncbi:MAG: potassium channel family protein [Vicinamibacterales bacterium]
MKFIPSQLAFVFTDREARANVGALLKYLLFLGLLVTAYAVAFHLIKQNVEGEQHSWITGFYWTLVVMTTLGFGDITFTSDAGRLFSIIVLLSGVVFLLVMLPFLFIRLFYAPWLEARVRFRAPREVPAGTAGHVILTEFDDVALGLVERFRSNGLPYFVIESDPARAARLMADHVSVVAGANDSRETYERLAVSSARLVVANCDDTANTNITLTVREAAPDVPLAAIAEHEDSIDILELSGATAVLPLKHRLGEHLANRVDVGRMEAHVVGSIRGVQIAELPVRGTPIAGVLVRETRLRERTGASVVGIWQRGRLTTAFPQTRIEPDGVAVIAGTNAQIEALHDLFPGERTPAPVLVIGAGKVGQAAAARLKGIGLTVFAIDRHGPALEALTGVDSVFAGDAADRKLIERAGIGEVASVLLTTNDDAMNIYLAVYCRRLNPALRIVSRITHERNVEAIHRAGADFALSYASLGVASIMSLLGGHPPMLFGEGVELFNIPVPAALAGQPLGRTAIGSRTGLSVVALEQDGQSVTQLTAETVLPPGGQLLMLGSLDQRQAFAEAFENGHAR